MVWGTQLYLSADEKKRYSVGSLERKMKSILSRNGLRQLLFWNTEDDEYTESVLRLCRENGVECWLWFPVLADPLVSVEGARPSTNYKGEYGMCSPGSMVQEESGEEDFLFICPSDLNFQEKTEQHLGALLDRYDYKGVFLDRIRFPSFANGFPLLFSCLCPDCCSSIGVDAGEISAEIENLTGEAFLNLINSIGADEKSSSANSQLKLFLSGRKKLITRKAESLSRIIRSRGRGVALDLFSPGLANFVGQDYASLSRIADWIKPMTYAMAWGPAGIPLELDCFYRGIRETFSDLENVKIIKAIDYMMQYEIDPFWKNREKCGFPLSLAYTEWNRTRKYAEDCSFLPGIEMVHSELFRTRVPESKVSEAIELFSNRSEIIACWNCLEIPDSYFSMLDQG